MTKDLDILTEYVRQSLARTITKIHQTTDGNIPLIILDQGVEKALSDSIQQTEQGSFLAMEPGIAQTIVNSLGRQLEKLTAINYQPLVLCSAQIRSHFKKFIDRFSPDLVVLSYDEILPNVEIKSLSTLELSDAD